MTKEERKAAFKSLITIELSHIPSEEHDLIWGSGQFFEYWTESGPNNKKLRFEYERTFEITRRYATWKRNHNRWNVNKPVKTQETFFEKALNKINSLQNGIN